MRFEKKSKAIISLTIKKDCLGFDLVWQSHFMSIEGSLLDDSHWVVREGDLGVNNEFQFYAQNTKNVQLSGSEIL
jgi:hypothetical protein